MRQGDTGLLDLVQILVAEGGEDRTVDRRLPQLALLGRHGLHVFFDDIEEIPLEVVAEVRDREFPVPIDHELVAGDETLDGGELHGLADLFEQIREDFRGGGVLGLTRVAGFGNNEFAAQHASDGGFATNFVDERLDLAEVHIAVLHIVLLSDCLSEASLCPRL